MWPCFVEGLFVPCVLGSLTGKEKLAEEGFLNKSHSGFSFFLFLFFLAVANCPRHDGNGVVLFTLRESGFITAVAPENAIVINRC